MKRGKKILVVGLIGLMMAAGLVLAGCSKCDYKGGTCNANSGTCSDSSCAANEAKAAGKYEGTCDC